MAKRNVIQIHYEAHGIALGLLRTLFCRSLGLFLADALDIVVYYFLFFILLF